MKKEVIVLSLGGSLIIPNDVNTKFLNEFKKIILKNSRKYKFIIVCGGGNIARKYIAAIKSNSKFQSLAGISATRMNARFMNYFFSNEPKNGIPLNINELKKEVSKNNIVFCGALGYHSNQTSDTTAATIAKQFNSKFINLTNVAGLYSSNPKTNKNAKFIPQITWKEFNKLANKSKFKPGQHFVLDQKASKIIMQNKISTYILGSNPKQLDNFLNNKKFKATEIKN